MNIALFFPDYGAQYVGMIKDLYDSTRIIQEYFEEASTCLPINFVKLFFASSEAELSLVENAYPALFLVEISLAELVLQENIKPTVIAGEGIGMVAALWAARSLNMPDGLYFLSKYAQNYQSLLDHDAFKAIMVKNISLRMLKKMMSEVSAHPEEDFAIACYYNDHDFMVTGVTPAIEALEQALKKNDKVITERSFVQKGLYSSRMQDVAQTMRMYSEKIDIHNALVPLINSLDGNLITSGKDLKTMVLEQITTTQRCDLIGERLAESHLIIEVSPRESSSWLRKRYPDKNIITVTNLAQIQKLRDYIS